MRPNEGSLLQWLTKRGLGGWHPEEPSTPERRNIVSLVHGDNEKQANF